MKFKVLFYSLILNFFMIETNTYICNQNSKPRLLRATIIEIKSEVSVTLLKGYHLKKGYCISLNKEYIQVPNSSLYSPQLLKKKKYRKG